MKNYTAHCSLSKVICQDFSKLETLFRTKESGFSLGSTPSDLVIPLSCSSSQKPACDPTHTLLDKYKLSLESV